VEIHSHRNEIFRYFEMKKKTDRFWKEIPLHEMPRDQWEALCDGCGRCCLRKLLFEDTGEVSYTRVVCRHLDMISCRCRCYAERSQIMTECMVLTPENLPLVLHLLPDTCAYRALCEGRDLPWWHPLVEGDPGMVNPACISIHNHMVCEDKVKKEDLEDYVIDWVST
jgi:uncharacterized cysteine cluster protein YcgN (CxxCxxCC family)